MNRKTKLELGEIAINPDNYDGNEDPRPHYIAIIYSGLNRHRKWADYFDDLYKMAKSLEKISDTWLIDLKNDCADYVFYLTMGIRIK